MSKEGDLQKRLLDKVDELSQEVARLRALDLDSIGTSRPRSGGRKSSKRDVKPDWVVNWNSKNASHGPVREIVKTTSILDATETVVGHTTELLEPVVLPEDKRLGVLHDERVPDIRWPDRPTSDAVPPRGLTQREVVEWLAKNPGNPLPTILEGATKPKRKQMTAMNKVWKYRNFKKCGNCEAYDTWEARVDPYNVANIGMVHAEIWCHTCSAIDYEVSDATPASIGTWAPPKETDKAKELREARRRYRWERTTFSLVQEPKTVGHLAKWFREVEHYEAIDMPMLEIQLRKMQKDNLVVLDRKTGLWWDKEDYDFEKQGEKK